MWLFTGRHRELGAAICVIAFIAASIGSVFVILAGRLITRQDLSARKVLSFLLCAVTISATIGATQGFGEPVFTPPNALNRGSALFIAILGALLGVVGAMLSNKARLLRVLLLVVASGLLFGDLTGWLWRSAGATK